MPAALARARNGLRRLADGLARRAPSLSLRSKLLVACLLLTTITVLLGAYAQWTQRSIGSFSVRIYDQTFLSMSYLREAQNGLLKLRAAIERVELRQRERTPEARLSEESVILASAIPTILEGLQVTHERMAGPDAARTTTWLHDHLLTLEGTLRERGTKALLASLDEIEKVFDTAVEIHAAEGFDDRREVERLIAASDRQTLAAIGLSVVLAALVSVLLARSVLPPIHAAVAVARAISQGRLDNAIVARGGSEVASLLRALSTMQASLAEKIGHINRLAAEARAQAERLEVQNGRFEGALENMNQGLSMFDADGRLVVRNRRFDEMFGPSESGPMRGAMLALTGPGTRDVEMPDGRTIAVAHQPIADGGWVDTFEDVTDRHRAEATLRRMARYDGLTKLLNRAFFRERLEETLEREANPIVLCLDLDGFKAVNDTLGHMVGDELLRLVAQRLLDCVRPDDIVGRLGGDEFAIVLTQAAETAAAEAVSRRILEALGSVFLIDAFQVVISTSIGIAREDGSPDAPAIERATQLLKNADVALYRAKAEGRATFRFFAPDMDQRLQARRLLEMDLRCALEKDQFALVFQPLVDAGTGAVRCFEALLRWNHPEKGLVSPAAFVPVAEETGLIKAIGQWVLSRACREAATWPRDVNVAVNLSAVQFNNPFLAAEVVKALDLSGLDPRRLELEITESVLIMQDEVVLATLHQIRSLGTRVALDDFGTGYSSLSYLSRFPFDKIKIDRSFVGDLTAADNLAIVRTIIGLGKTLKMEVVAEGVETAAQRDVLVAEGCAELQGYFYSPPRSAGEVAGLIDRLGAVALGA